MYSEEKRNQKEVLTKVINKCWEDSSFKKELIASPTKTLESFLGRVLNKKESKTLVVNDQTDTSTVYINIPPKPNFENVELTDEELEAIAGGDYEILWTLICDRK